MKELRLFTTGGTTRGRSRRALILALLPVSLLFVESAYADSLAPVTSSVTGSTAPELTGSVAATTPKAPQVTSTQPSEVAPLSEIPADSSALPLAPQPVQGDSVPTEPVVVEAVVEETETAAEPVVKAISGIPAAVTGVGIDSVDTAKDGATGIVAATNSTLEKAVQAPSPGVDAVVRTAKTALPSLTRSVVQTAAKVAAIGTGTTTRFTSAADGVTETVPVSIGVTRESTVRHEPARFVGLVAGWTVVPVRMKNAAADLTKDATTSGAGRVQPTASARLGHDRRFRPALTASFDGATPLQRSARALRAPIEPDPPRAPLSSAPGLPAGGGGTAPFLLLLLGLGIAPALIRAPGRLSGRLSLAVAALRPHLLSLSLERPG